MHAYIMQLHNIKMDSYNFFNRLDKLNIKYRLINLTKKEVENNIKTKSIVRTDEDTKNIITNMNQFDKYNYNICIEHIIKQEQYAKYYNNDIFKFTLYDTCPYTNYSYMSIFFGPLDNNNFFCDTYKHITHFLSKPVCIEISIENELLKIKLKYV